MNNLYLLITIVRRGDCEEYERFYESDGVGIIYSIPCNGTAHAKTLDLFGLEKTEKSMLMSVVTEASLKDLCKKLSRDMMIDLPDRGVALAVSLSGIAGARTLEYFTATQMTTDDTEANTTEEKKMQSAYELIVAIYEKGNTDVVMDAARAAGAGGGTTIRAKGTGADAQKFFGLTLAEEKEILFIVSTNEKKKDIMKAIIHEAGPDSKAHALVFSLPVSETAGFRFTDTIEKE